MISKALVIVSDRCTGYLRQIGTNVQHDVAT